MKIEPQGLYTIVITPENDAERAWLADNFLGDLDQQWCQENEDCFEILNENNEVISLERVGDVFLVERVLINLHGF